MKPHVEIYDTTLRDGAQAEGINFSAADKLRIAEKLDSFGVHYIEGGWPGSNPKDMEFFQQAARRKWKHARIAAFSMTRRKGVAVEKDELMRLILEAKTPVVTIVGKTWLLHVTEVLRARPEENLGMIADTIRFLKDHGKQVIYDAEHFRRPCRRTRLRARHLAGGGKSRRRLHRALRNQWRPSAPEIAPPPSRSQNLQTELPHRHPHPQRLRLWCGERHRRRRGRCDAGAGHHQRVWRAHRQLQPHQCHPHPAIENGPGVATPKGSLAKLKELSEFVNEVANVRHDVRAPWVGQTAFAHKGGMHVHAIERVSRSYEHVNPESIGNFRRVLVSDMSGRTNILLKARELGYQLESDAPAAREITARVKELEGRGYEYEAAEGSLALMIGRAIQQRDPSFTVETYHVSMRRDKRESICEATVRVRVGDDIAHTVAEGDGPVNALDGALRRALVKFFPSLKAVELTDYKVRIINGATGTAARTRVLITSSNGRREWGTVGVSENIIEASLEALVDSMEYALLKR
jgi:2-isopropylmalate synthase